MSVPLLNLKFWHCRWPLDNGEFCGCPKTRGSYCKEHAERAYITQTPPTTTAEGAPDQVASTEIDYSHG